MSGENNLTYKKAVDELEKIIKEMEEDTVDVDDLLKKLERAMILITYCKEKLKNSEVSIQEIIKKLEE